MQGHFLKHEILRLLDYLEEESLVELLDHLKRNYFFDSHEALKLPLRRHLDRVFFEDAQILTVVDHD